MGDGNGGKAKCQCFLDAGFQGSQGKNNTLFLRDSHAFFKRIASWSILTSWMTVSQPMDGTSCCGAKYVIIGSQVESVHVIAASLETDHLSLQYARWLKTLS